MNAPPHSSPPDPLSQRQALVILVVIILLQGLVALPELMNPAPMLHDGALHLHQVERLGEAWARGESLIDHWDSAIGLGYPFFRSYAPLTHLLIGSMVSLGGDLISPEMAWHLLVFFGWTLLPLTVFIGLRGLGLSRGQALAAAWIMGLIHTGFRFGIAPETFFWFSPGLLPNLLGLLWFPLGLGLGVRFLREGNNLGPALLTGLLTWLSHTILGYMLALSLVVFAVHACLAPDQRMRILRRLLLLGLTTALGGAFFLHPYLTDGLWINHTHLEPKPYWDSYGTLPVLKATFTGGVLDGGRWLPLFSLLALVGFVTECRSHRWRSVWLWLFGFWWVGYLGRHTPFAMLFPFNTNLSFERLILMVQWFGVILAGIGLNHLGQWLLAKRRTSPKWTTALVGVTILLMQPIYPNLFFSWRYTPVVKQTAIVMSKDSFPEQAQALAFLANQSDGSRLFTTPRHSDDPPLPHYWHQPIWHHLDHIGTPWHTMSRNADWLMELNPERLDHWQLFGLKYGLFYGPPPPFLTTLDQGENWVFARMNEPASLFRLGHIVGVLPKHEPDQRQAIRTWLHSDAPAQHAYLVHPQWADLFPVNPTVERPPSGQVLGPRVLQDGSFGYELRVKLDQPSTLIGSITYHPNWRVTVDDDPVDLAMVAPALVALPLSPGNHRVVLRYHASTITNSLIILTLVTLIFAFCWDWRRSRFLKQFTNTQSPS